MKTLKLLLVIFSLTLFSNTLSAQTEPEVIAVITKASWCPTCVKNGPRVESEVLPKVDASKISILVNDLSDDTTKKASLLILKEIGLEEVSLKSTGIISFIDLKSKKVLSTIKVGKSTEEILKEFERASVKM